MPDLVLIINPGDNYEFGILLSSETKEGWGGKFYTEYTIKTKNEVKQVPSRLVVRLVKDVEELPQDLNAFLLANMQDIVIALARHSERSSHPGSRRIG